MRGERPVVGVDGFRERWLAVVLAGGAFVEARLFRALADVCGAYPHSAAYAVDVPIGLPPPGERRRADVEARAFVGRRRASVFFTPPRTAMGAPTYGAALALAPTLSAQSFALRAKILEANHLAVQEDRIFEVHPEVSFRAMAGEELPFSKKTWSGVVLRRALLAHAGIVLPDDLGEAGLAGPDDVLDAAAAAWSAHRIAHGSAGRLPGTAPARDGREAAILY